MEEAEVWPNSAANNYQNTSAYSKSFAEFLAHTNEKSVLTERIAHLIKSTNTKSVLDIGAGNGEVSFPLAKLVDHYLAVEHKEDYARKLRDGGITVVQDTFPCTIDSKTDLVLISHSLPPLQTGDMGWELFLRTAFAQVAEGGRLALITFEDEASEWDTFVRGAGLEWHRTREERITPMMQYLEQFGNVEKEIITTHVQTDTAAGLQKALAFVWSDGDEAHTNYFMQNEAVREYLEKNHAVEGGYSFPFHHYLLLVSKT